MADLSAADKTFLQAMIDTHTAALTATTTYLKAAPADRRAVLTDFATMHQTELVDELKQMRAWLAGSTQPMSKEPMSKSSEPMSKPMMSMPPGKPMMPMPPGMGKH